MLEASVRASGVADWKETDITPGFAERVYVNWLLQEARLQVDVLQAMMRVIFAHTVEEPLIFDVGHVLPTMQDILEKLAQQSNVPVEVAQNLCRKTLMSYVPEAIIDIVVKRNELSCLVDLSPFSRETLVAEGKITWKVVPVFDKQNHFQKFAVAVWGVARANQSR